MSESTLLQQILPWLSAFGGAVLTAAFFLGRKSDLLQVVPRLQKLIEGDPESKEGLARFGDHKRLEAMEEVVNLVRSQANENARFIRVWQRIKGIPTGSGELELELQMRAAMTPAAKAQADADVRDSRNSVLREFDERVSPPEHEAPRQLERFRDSRLAEERASAHPQLLSDLPPPAQKAIPTSKHATPYQTRHSTGGYPTIQRPGPPPPPKRKPGGDDSG